MSSIHKFGPSPGQTTIQPQMSPQMMKGRSFHQNNRAHNYSANQEVGSSSFITEPPNIMMQKQNAPYQNIHIKQTNPRASNMAPSTNFETQAT